MAVKLYPHVAVATTHRGTNTAKLDTTASWWVPKLMDTSQGTSVVNRVTNTVTGPTNGVEVTDTAAGLPIEWISEPLSADFTVSGTITLNIRCAESSMSANVAINVAIDNVAATDGTLTRIATSARTTEETLTTETAANFTVTPTSTSCLRGDRIRLRIYADDSAAATMAAALSFTVWFDGAASATGDTWIQFTENLTFEPAGNPTVSVTQGTRNTFQGFGDSTGFKFTQPFVASMISVTTSTFWAAKQGSPTDNFIIEIQSDNAGNPSGTVLGTVATIAGTTLTTTVSFNSVSGLNIALTPGVTYHYVFRRSGAQDAANYFTFGAVSGTPPSGWTGAQYDSTGSNNWVSLTTLTVTISLVGVPFIYYLTDTAATINPGSATEKVASSTRGSGSVSSITNTAAGPTAGIQTTATGGGTAIEWYTPPLLAFTFGGKTKFNIRALESATTIQASLRAEIAICATDGTSPVVWGAANIEALLQGTDLGELTATDTATFAWVAGDNIAITSGQRLRFRIYIDDIANGPLVTGGTATITYNGATAAAAGDSYVILPVGVTELGYVLPAAFVLAVPYRYN